MYKPAIPVVTCSIYHKDKFLVIRRHDKAKKFGGTWGFPGGKVEIGETVAGALIREIKEETGLKLDDKLLFVDTYYYGDSVGLHFTAFSDSDKVTPEAGVEFKWLSNLAELQKLPHIPGIDFHIVKTQELLSQKSPYLSLDSLNYIPEKYIN
jgi:mutator protein MutT